MKKWLLYFAVFTTIAFTLFLYIFFRNLNNFINPMGQFGIGTITHHLIDHERKDPNNPSTYRELMLQIWYPISAKINAQTFYHADALSSAQEFLSHATKFPYWFFTSLEHTKTFAQANAPISQLSSQYPIIIISHGAGTMIQHYTFLAEELASQGYIVVGVNHPYMAAYTRFPDGRLIESLAETKRKESKDAQLLFKEQQFAIAIQDISFVLDSLEKLKEEQTFPLHDKLDLEHIGICGHSAGGSLAMRMCIEDKRLKVGVSLDGSTDRGNPELKSFSTPFLFIRGEASHVWRDQEGKERKQKVFELCNKQGMNMTVITFINNGHGTFSDLPILLHATYATQMLSRFVDVNIGASSAKALKAIKVTKRYVNAFFAKYLLNEPALFFEHPQCDLEIVV